MFEKTKEKIKKAKEEMNVKNWSLKKKVTLGLGVMGAAALGVFAYGASKHKQTSENADFGGEDYDDEEDYDRDFEDEEVEETVETTEE